MPSPPDLPRTQHLIWTLITAPTGVEPGAEALVSSGGLESTDLSFVIAGDDRLGPAHRLSIYADMYFYRLRDSLSEDFPKVAAVIGGARFHNLVTDYLLVHPSSFWSLRNLGKALPDFLKGRDLAAQYPFLPDLARLEWARVDVFDEADARAMTREQVTAIAGDAIGDLRLSLIPACRLLALDWNVAPLWRSVEDLEAGHEPGGTNSASVEGSPAMEEMPAVEVGPPLKERGLLRVWRRAFTVYHRTVRADEYACLQLMSRGGATLPGIGECVLERTGDDEGESREDVRSAAAARRIAVLIESWIEDGILVRKE